MAAKKGNIRPKNIAHAVNTQLNKIFPLIICLINCNDI